MKTYFIADDNGTIYAHDIQSREQAEAILADTISALESKGKAIPDGLEILSEDISEFTVYWIGGDRDGEVLAVFEEEYDAERFAKSFEKEHEGEFDSFCGGVGINDADGNPVEW